MTTPTIETLNYLRTALTSDQVTAFVTQNADDTVAISVDIGPGPGQLTIDPLVGSTGSAGSSQFALIPMPDVYDSPADLPALGVLTNTYADIGKFWIITQDDDSGGVTSTGAYIWFGTKFRFLPFGPQGPPGPYPVIQPYVELIGPRKNSSISVPDTTTGSAANPYLLTVNLSVPEGPPGRCAPLATFPDVDEASPPIVGQFMAYTGQTIAYSGSGSPLPLWAPQNVGDIPPMPYTVPASAFRSQLGITFASEVTIATFNVPPQSFPWKPIVFGQVQLFELELSLQPFLIGVEVRLGSPNGTLVGRGFGNSLGGVCTIFPHCSSPGDPHAQMTPWNSTALVEANHNGTSGTLYVNVVNDGLVAIYDFNAGGAELFVWACPATTQAQLGRTSYGSLTTKIALSAQTITKFAGVRMTTSGVGRLTAGRVAGVGKVGYTHGRGALTSAMHPKFSAALAGVGKLAGVTVSGSGHVAYMHSRGVLTNSVKGGVVGGVAGGGALTTVQHTNLTGGPAGRGRISANTFIKGS